MEVGFKGTLEIVVEKKHTAAAEMSGSVEVFATPRMIALFECAAAKSVQSFLDEGCTTVGTRIDITHDRATPVGHTVRIETELTGIEGRKLTFKCEAFDEKGHIGGGMQERFIVNTEKFMSKLV